MKSIDVRKKYIAFFVSRGHTEIPSAPLVPQNDPTTLFNSSGMQPLVPYLLGEPHPAGKRLVNSQKAIRTQDIDEVGDNRHTTFFEMLGNWSLGDYFKKEQLPWIFEFLTSEIGLDPHRLYVTVFEGNESVPKDTDSIEIWKNVFATVGIDAKEGERIFTYPAKKNWWSRSGEPEKMPPGEPGGPDSEVFFDFGKELGHHEKSEWKSEPCHPNCDCGRFMEIANSVFMQYKKETDGSLKELSQKNVDFGGGLERMVAATNDNPDVFYTDLFLPIISKLQEFTRYRYNENDLTNKYFRRVSDHIKASIMLVSDGVLPSNKDQGYVLRRLLRKAIWYGRNYLLIDKAFTKDLVVPTAQIYLNVYPNVERQCETIKSILEEEEKKFLKTIDQGNRMLPEITKKFALQEKIKNKEGITAVVDKLTHEASGELAFNMYETFGLPPDLVKERLEELGWSLTANFEDEFVKAKKRHQELSRTAGAGRFKGGLADHSEATTKLHTAHHLLLAALQQLVDPSIKQRGSNITSERLRMDFSFARKVTPEELAKVESLVNEKITEDLPVARVEMAREEAEKVGAQMEFGHKYPDRVNVYFVGPQESYFSAEFCGGPHVEHTGVIGHFRIKKEESASAGVRRIYGVIE